MSLKPLYDQDIFPEKQSKIGHAAVTMTFDSVKQAGLTKGLQTSLYFVLYPEIQFLAFS